MKKSLVKYMCLALAFLPASLPAETDSLYVRVHFLHGSKPKRKFRHEEDRWFGGLIGGHAGVEIERNRILNFTPKARFHVFAKPRIINSRFTVHDTASFYQILGNRPDSVKKTIITIPVTRMQQRLLDSLGAVYLQRCPYDYAFFGMRCGAATYDVLAGAGLLPKYRFAKTWRKTFYPRKLRRRLERAAAVKGYRVYKEQGSPRRRWERY